jgi:hypothetical protein
LVYFLCSSVSFAGVKLPKRRVDRMVACRDVPLGLAFRQLGCANETLADAIMR